MYYKAFFDFQLYCCQWLGKENIICGGSDMNMARVIDRGTLNVITHSASTLLLRAVLTLHAFIT